MKNRAKLKRSTHVLGTIALVPIFVIAFHSLTFQYQIAHGLEDHLRERVIRRSLIKDRSDIHFRRYHTADGLYFLSLDEQKGKRTEASDSLLARLPIGRVRFAKLSELEIAPEKGVCDSPRFRHRQSKERGEICYIDIDWKSRFRVDVSIRDSIGIHDTDYSYVGVGRLWLVQTTTITPFKTIGCTQPE